jgi:hypothetical protein
MLSVSSTILAMLCVAAVHAETLTVTGRIAIGETLSLPSNYSAYVVSGCHLAAVAFPAALRDANVTIHNSTLAMGGVHFTHLEKCRVEIYDVSFPWGSKTTLTVDKAVDSVIKLHDSRSFAKKGPAFHNIVSSDILIDRVDVESMSSALEIGAINGSSVVHVGDSILVAFDALDASWVGHATTIDLRNVTMDGNVALTSCTYVNFNVAGSRLNGPLNIFDVKRATIHLGSTVITARETAIWVAKVQDSHIDLFGLTVVGEKIGVEFDGLETTVVRVFTSTIKGNTTAISVVDSTSSTFEMGGNTIEGTCVGVKDCATAAPGTHTTTATPGATSAPAATQWYDDTRLYIGVAVGVVAAGAVVAVIVAVRRRRRQRARAEGAYAEVNENENAV